MTGTAFPSVGGEAPLPIFEEDVTAVCSEKVAGRTVQWMGTDSGRKTPLWAFGIISVAGSGDRRER